MITAMDDAQMAPADNLFDGYNQRAEDIPSKYKPGDVVPNVNIGGWHDAGDFDLRVESQAGEAYILTMAYEAFHPDIDVTSIDQIKRITEIPSTRRKEIRYVATGRKRCSHRSKRLLPAFVICTEVSSVTAFRQYVLLGDASAMTDGKLGTEDDRWIYTRITRAAN